MNALSNLAKAGWAAKGSLYVTLGVLAVMAAVGEGGGMSGSRGVLAWVEQQPLGRVLLVAAGVGFAAYAIWRFAQAVVDPQSHDSTGAEVATRIGWAASGILHAGLSVAAFQMFAGSAGSSKKTWLAAAMSWGDWGTWLVGALGLGAIIAGAHQLIQAAKLGFMDEVSTAEMSDKEVKALETVGRFGHGARGVTFPIIGYFLIAAAVNHSASQAKGLGGALSELARASWLVLAVVAVGLTSYGVLQFFYVRYRNVEVASDRA
ncbi:MAG: DUF1206 domain-containing protein [Nannocystaceae bacterium]|nr:DUF1206 domain-containing protein [bacterium]